MRFGPRVILITVLAFAALSAPAWAADTLNVYVDNNQIALGMPTTLAAHAETDAAFGGGHVAFKFKSAGAQCQATPDTDEGTDANGDQPPHVATGAGSTDVGGQIIQLDVGSWVVCGWLVDESTGAVVAAGSTIVQVVPYQGSLSMKVTRSAQGFQFVVSWTTSSAAYLYAWLQPAAKSCPENPTRVPKAVVPIVPKSGRLVGSDGGLGRIIKANVLTSGRWRACGWLRALDTGGAGPVTTTFSVPKRRQRAGHAAG